MFKFLKKDPIKKAKKHIDKALKELDEDYPDYASVEFERAAQLFLQEGKVEFAVKYYREAAYAALEDENHIRAAEMKIAAAEVLLTDKMYDEAGTLYSEASDHFFREKKMQDSTRALSMGVLCLLASRNFDSAVNLFRKAEKRVAGGKKPACPEYDFAQHSVRILFEGVTLSQDHLDRVISKVKPRPAEEEMVLFLSESVRLANETEVRIEWAGPESDEVSVKVPIEFELIYKSPVPVRVTECRFNLSSSLRFTKEPAISHEPATEESWLFELTPVLSGDGTVGPFKLTLEGESVLAHKVSNSIGFRISRAPADLALELTPSKISCDLGDEVIFDILIINRGDGPADNIELKVELSDGLQVSMGNAEKVINFLGSSETMHFQLFVKGVGLGEEYVTVRVQDSMSDKAIEKRSIVIVE